MRDVTNWYLSVEAFREPLDAWLARLGASQAWREFAIREVQEYFGLPALYIKRDELENVDEALSSPSCRHTNASRARVSRTSSSSRH